MFHFFHLFSPVTYMFFVHVIQYLPQCPKSNSMKIARKWHNIGLSVMSLIMMVGIFYGTMDANKFKTLDELICKQYDKTNNTWFIVKISIELFLWSKYWEWLDTLFLHLSGKPISWLQYTHHMSTAFLTYLNKHNNICTYAFILMGLNCCVHVFMYWYFAYPKGVLYRFRKLITQSQIVQHVICCCTTIYAYSNNCKQNMYANECAILLYLMYLIFFSAFYINTYFKRERQKIH